MSHAKKRSIPVAAIVLLSILCLSGCDDAETEVGGDDILTDVTTDDTTTAGDSTSTSDTDDPGDTSTSDVPPSDTLDPGDTTDPVDTSVDTTVDTTEADATDTVDATDAADTADTVDCSALANACDTEGRTCDADTLERCAPDADGCLVLTGVDCAAAGGTCEEADGSAACAGAAETDCADGIDDDGNGSIDCRDAACAGDAACCAADGEPGTTDICCSASDPDENNLCGAQGGCGGPTQTCSTDADCCEGTCIAAMSPLPPGQFCCVSDGLDYASEIGEDYVCCSPDTDENGLCGEQTGTEQCTNTTDDDGDGLTDCDDADCDLAPGCGNTSCLPDGEVSADPAECCNGDPDMDFFCGERPCLADGEFAFGQNAECCNGDPDGDLICG